MVEQLQQINWVELLIQLIVGGVFIGGVVSAVILIAEYFYFVGKRKPIKRLQCFNYHVAGVDAKYTQQVEVLYQRQPVTNWGNIVLKFGNNGRKPIRIDDYEKGKPIKFIFPENTNFLDEPEVRTTYPDNLQCEIKTINDHIIEVSPLMLNHKEYFVLSVLAENPQMPDLDVRIVGVSEVEEEPDPNAPQIQQKYMGCIMSLMFIILLLIISVYLIRFVFLDSSSTGLSEFSTGFWYGVAISISLGFIFSLLGRYWKMFSVLFKSQQF